MAFHQWCIECNGRILTIREIELYRDKCERCSKGLHRTPSSQESDNDSPRVKGENNAGNS